MKQKAVEYTNLYKFQPHYKHFTKYYFSVKM